MQLEIIIYNKNETKSFFFKMQIILSSTYAKLRADFNKYYIIYYRD